jgi:hypothetical protein
MPLRGISPATHNRRTVEPWQVSRRGRMCSGRMVSSGRVCTVRPGSLSYLLIRLTPFSRRRWEAAMARRSAETRRTQRKGR